jgi:hypothetical protein
MKTIKIIKGELQEALKTALKVTRNHSFSGWGIPIYANDYGDIESGGMICLNDKQSDVLEIYRVNTWESSVKDEDDDGQHYEYESMIHNIIEDIERTDFNQDPEGGYILDIQW